jgi:hypothetical protein
MLQVALTVAWAEVEMVAVHNHRVASGRLGKPAQCGQETQCMQETRRRWVPPTWERLETPMEVTMYAGQR